MYPIGSSCLLTQPGKLALSANQSIEMCNSVAHSITVPFGYVYTLFYPYPYQRGRDCSKTITLHDPNATALLLTSLHVNLWKPVSEECGDAVACDYLQVLAPGDNKVKSSSEN